MKKNLYLTLLSHVLLVLGVAIALTTDLGIHGARSAPIAWIFVAVMVFSATMFGYELRTWVASASDWRERQFLPSGRHEWIDLLALALLYSGIFIPQVWVWLLSLHQVVFVLLAVACLVIAGNRVYSFTRIAASRKQRQSDLQSDLLIAKDAK